MKLSKKVAVVLLTVAAVASFVAGAVAQGVRSNTRKPMATEDDFRQAMKDLSNWGRWGQDDELGAANLITRVKRKQALALAKEGIAVSMAHNIFQEDVRDGNGHPHDVRG